MSLTTEIRGLGETVVGVLDRRTPAVARQPIYACVGAGELLLSQLAALPGAARGVTRRAADTVGPASGRARSAASTAYAGLTSRGEQVLTHAVLGRRHLERHQHVTTTPASGSNTRTTAGTSAPTELRPAKRAASKGPAKRAAAKSTHAGRTAGTATKS